MSITSTYLASRDALREKIMSRIDFSRKVEDKEVLDLIDDHITSNVPEMLENLSVEEKKRLRQDLFHSIRRLDVLQELVEDPQITEIMVNGPNSIFIEKAGELRPCKAAFSSMGKLEDVIQLLFRNYLPLYRLPLIALINVVFMGKTMISTLFLASLGD